jgi:Bifunctional DNA primase/polymerase, N-terminal
MDKLLLTINQCCWLAGIGRTKFYELVAGGKIPVRKVGKKTLVAAAVEAVGRAPSRNGGEPARENKGEKLAQGDGAMTVFMLQFALRYAGRGWHVFPLHSVQDGRCTCGRDCGKNAGKHPRVKGGFKAATTDVRQIEAWWRKWPDANIGIATGAMSGIVVIDVDGEAGRATLQRLVAQHGLLPRTEMVRTSRGWHLYFGIPDACSPIPCSTGDGLDVRGDGGYVVAPPSRHASGHIYQWCEHVG